MLLVSDVDVKCCNFSLLFDECFTYSLINKSRKCQCFKTSYIGRGSFLYDKEYK